MPHSNGKGAETAPSQQRRVVATVGTRSESPPRVDRVVARAYAEAVKAREIHKTRRTWAICGTVVAGIGIISLAALRRQGAL